MHNVYLSRMEMSLVINIFLLFLTLDVVLLEFNSNPNSNQYRTKQARFFGVGLVRFQNSACTSASNIQGTCYRRRQCSDIGGVSSGSCASGIGVCCVVLRSCGTTSSYNNTYFSNTNYPTPVTDGARCTMVIQKCNSGICQVRIDFLSFNLAQPIGSGVCSTDALTITGGGGRVHVICGDNTGQHVYIDFNGNDTIVMTITTGSANFGRLWNFKVTQIACDCPTRAPSGCLQFYNSTTGTVNSFNFATGGNSIDTTTGLAGTRELVNENYGVCVHMLPGYCSLQWSSNSFVVTGVPNLGFGAQTNGDCTTDFVVIPNPSYLNGTPVNSDRFCGTAFDTVTNQGFCGGSSSNNNTYFINRGYPATFSGSTSCSFTIQPTDNICQIRLDFLNLILAQPDGNGNCIFDSLVITGSGTGNVPIICGENSGHHMYLMVNGKNGISIRITTSAMVSMARSWNVKITQIACDCPTQAPIGCLQYYTSQSGTVTSFNYGTSINGNNVNIGTMAVSGSRQIANHNYGICIKTLPGYCSINWRQSSDSESFTVTGDSATAAATTGLPGAALTGVACTTDYVVISNPYFPNGMAVNTDRFCGNSFPRISSSSKPFILTTVTNSDETSDVANRGFSFDFNQVACANFAYLMFTV